MLQVALVQLLIQSTASQGPFQPCVDLSWHILLFLFLALRRFVFAFLCILFLWLVAALVFYWVGRGMHLCVWCRWLNCTWLSGSIGSVAGDRRLLSDLDAVDRADLGLAGVTLPLASASLGACLAIGDLGDALLEDDAVIAVVLLSLGGSLGCRQALVFDLLGYFEVDVPKLYVAEDPLLLSGLRRRSEACRVATSWIARRSFATTRRQPGNLQACIRILGVELHLRLDRSIATKSVGLLHFAALGLVQCLIPLEEDATRLLRWSPEHGILALQRVLLRRDQ